MPQSIPVQQPTPDRTALNRDTSGEANAAQSSPEPSKEVKKERAFNAGRFDNDPERARIAGRKGGANPNNAGRFDNNPARAREAGQKGGQSSQASRNNAKH